jgi:hypothetical protein
MRSHGVSGFPLPTSPGATAALRRFKKTGGSTPTFQAAARACRKYAPPGAAAPQLTAEDRSDYLRAAPCMRDHGIAGFPDPLFTGGHVSFPIPKTMDPNSPTFLHAREICEMLIPPGLPYSKEAEGGR